MEVESSHLIDVGNTWSEPSCLMAVANTMTASYMSDRLKVIESGKKINN